MSWYFVDFAANKERLFAQGVRKQRLYAEKKAAQTYFLNNAENDVSLSDLLLYSVRVHEASFTEIGGQDRFGKYAIAHIPERALTQASSLSLHPPTELPDGTQLGTEVIDVHLNPNLPKKMMYRKVLTSRVDADDFEVVHGDQRKIIYVSYPVEDDLAIGLKKIANICRTVRNDKRIPIAPYLMLYHACDSSDDVLADVPELIQLADEIWLYGDKVTIRMEHEAMVAREWGIPVRIKSPSIRECDAVQN